MYFDVKACLHGAIGGILEGAASSREAGTGAIRSSATGVGLKTGIVTVAAVE